MKKTILLMAVCLCFIGKASAQWVVSDPGNLAQGIINTTKQIVQTSTTAKNTLDGFMEAQKIFQQGKKYYDALKAVHDVVKGGVKVKKSIELVAEISEIYVRNFQNMLADPNFTPDELSAISFGYAKLMSESSDVLQDLKNVVNITGMSLTDAERLAIIDNAYRSLLNYRNLVNYYTRKNISVSYLRAKKKNDTDRVLALYGSADERYWEHDAQPQRKGAQERVHVYGFGTCERLPHFGGYIEQSSQPGYPFRYPRHVAAQGHHFIVQHPQHLVQVVKIHCC